MDSRLVAKYGLTFHQFLALLALCEWSPRSGTLYGEPLYGPPELVPSYQNQFLSPKKITCMNDFS